MLEREGVGHGAGLLMDMFPYVLLTPPGFLLSRHDDGVGEGLRRKTWKEAVQIGMGGSAAKQGAGWNGEKHVGAMESRDVQDQRWVQPPETRRRPGGQITGSHAWT